MANGNDPFNTNKIRRPGFRTAVAESTGVVLPENIEPPKGREITPAQAVLRAANEGRIDLGEEGQGVTPEQAIARLTVRQAAQEVLPRVVEDSFQRFSEEAAEMASSNRYLSAANNFYRGLTEFVPAAIQTKVILEAELQNLFLSEDEQLDPTLMPQYQLGQEIGRQLEEIFPTSVAFREEFWAGTMAKAAGQMTGNIIVSLATAGVGGGALAATGASGALNATLGSNFYKEAKAEGASDDEAFQFTLLNMASTAGLEALPMARFVTRVNRATGGGVSKALKEGFKGSIEEGVTEAMQEYVTNASAIDIFDSQRDLMDGIVEAFGAGAILGAAVNSTLPSLVERALIEDQADQMADTYATIEYVSEMGELSGETPLTRNDTNEFLNRYVEGKDRSPDDVVEGNTGVGVTHAEVDKSSSKFKESKKKWKEIWKEQIRRHLHTGGVLGKETAVRKEKMNAQIEKQLEVAHTNFVKINKAFLEHYDSKHKNMYDAIRDPEDNSDPSMISRIDGVLRGETSENVLPERLRGPVKRARMHIDQLSTDMIKSGLVQGKLIATFIKNLGVYIHRDFRAFDQETTWNRSTIPDDVWNSGIAFFRNQRIKAYKEEMNKEPLGSDLTKIRAKAEEDVKKVLLSTSVSSAFQMLKGRDFAQDAGDRDILLERQDLPVPIRKLLGEYTDPAVNYVNTINEMATLIEKRRYFDDIADKGRGSLFFTQEELIENQPDADFNDYVQGIPDGVGSKLSNDPGKDVNGDLPPKLFMHKDIYDALTYRPHDHPGWLKHLIRVNTLAKYSKTVLSHVAHARNVLGGVGFLTVNGHMFNRADRDASWRKAATVFRSYESLDAKGLEELWVKYVDLGLVSGSVRGGEMLDLLQDVDWDTPSEFMENFNHAKATAQGKGLYKKSKSWFKKYSRKLTNLYKLEDAFLRTWMFELEKARMQEADPSITDQEVADMVNDLYPNYDRLNETLKKFRFFPGAAPFISFPAEVVRTTFHSVKIGLEQTRSDNAKIRKIGYQRLAGMLTTNLAVLGIGAASQMLMRMDDEEEQAVRHFLPPWDRNSILAYLDASRGRVRYVNTSYTNPHEYLLDPLFAVVAGDSDRTILQRLGQGFMEMINPLISEELAAGALLDIAEDIRSGGGNIWNPEDTLADKAQKMFLHFWEAVEPGTLTSLDRFFEPLVDEESEKKVSDELFGLFGLRITTVDVKRSYGFRIRDFRQRIRDARKVYNSVKFRKGASRSEKRDALERANNRYEEIFNEMQQITDAAQKSGVSWLELKAIMKDSGLANRDINGLRTGVFTQFKP